MSAPRPASPDPLIDTPAPPVSGMDYPAHVETYNRFLNLVKWFIYHMCLLVPALYFLIIGGNMLLGTILVVLAIALLIFGLMRNPHIRDDVTDPDGPAPTRNPDTAGSH